MLLARMAWLEAGAHVQAGEVAAMHEVITTRQPDGMSYQRMAYAYSAGLRNPRLVSVHRLGRAPLGMGWPELHRREWPRVLAAADAAIAGTLRHGCDTDAPLQHFGGPHVDRASITRLTRSQYVRATCPDGYANTFLLRGVRAVYPRGERSGAAKLTEEQAKDVVLRRFGGESCKALAEVFGIHPSHVSRISRGKKWKHLLSANAFLTRAHADHH